MAQKRDIRYLDAAALRREAHRLLDVRLATYHYRDESDSRPAPPGLSDRRRAHQPRRATERRPRRPLRLHGVAVAAVADQDKARRLSTQVTRLEAELEELRGTCAAPVAPR